METPVNCKIFKTFVRYNEVSLYRGYFSCFTSSGVKKIVRYNEDFVIQGFFISRFYCITCGRDGNSSKL